MNKKNKIKSLIFGISGQDGSYLGHFLLGQGHHVYGTSRNIKKKKFSNLNKLGVLNKIKIIKCDTKNSKIVKKLIKKIKPAEIYYLSNLPARISYFEVLFIAFLAIFLTFISTIYPAIKSSKIDPAKILRNE